MKTKIKVTVVSIFYTLLLSFTLLAQPTNQDNKVENTKVNVYYFHFNLRCESCRAIEDESKADVSMLFGKDVSFSVYNLDEAAGEAKAKELGVNSQSLWVMKGDKKINLTNEGFLYARTNPEKFKKVIEDKIKPLL